MIRAAGILFLAPDNTALFLKRGPGGDHPGEWCWPGGTTEGDETPEQTAVREAIEECGAIPDGLRTEWTRSINAFAGASTDVPQPAPMDPASVQVDFTTFLQRVDKQFIPTVNGEHTGYAWAPVDAPPAPTHPGCFIAAQRFTMDELGVARAMAAGNLTSPQRYHNVTLWALRITGTGAAYRHKHKEYVWRDPAIYMTEDFLARCNGLAVIMMHPKKRGTLNSEEFEQRVIGSIMLPYLKPPDEVWGIAKVYDDDANKMMTDNQMSTSPAVVLREAGNTRLELESGEKLLIEGIPSLLDHLAICEQGVWDKGGEPTGVLNERKDQSMSDAEKAALEEKARQDAEARARADAETGSKLDKILTGLDSVHSRMDAQEKDLTELKADRQARKDAEEKAKAERDDASAVAAYSARKDDDDDASYAKRHDAEEAAEREGHEKAGATKEVAADKAKRHRKDAEEKLEKEYADRKARKDSEDVRTRLTNVERQVKPRTDDERKQLAAAQARADQVFMAFGDSAQRPMDGEDLISYRRRMAGLLQPHSARWKGLDLTAIADSAFSVVEDQVYADALVASHMPADLKDGEIRYIPRVDAATGVRTIVGVGRRSFVSQFKRQPRGRVGQFLLKGRQAQAST